jgi:hypothetical protein
LGGIAPRSSLLEAPTAGRRVITRKRGVSLLPQSLRRPPRTHGEQSPVLLHCVWEWRAAMQPTASSAQQRAQCAVRSAQLRIQLHRQRDARIKRQKELLSLFLICFKKRHYVQHEQINCNRCRSRSAHCSSSSRADPVGISNGYIKRIYPTDRSNGETRCTHHIHCTHRTLHPPRLHTLHTPYSAHTRCTRVPSKRSEPDFSSARSKVGVTVLW